jgi:hypothetical protein
MKISVSHALQALMKGMVISMEIKNYTNYDIADVTEDDLKNISDLEKSLCSNTKEDIVLIAYKHIPSEIAEK